MHKKQAAIWMTLLLSVFVLSPVMALADSHLQGEELEAGAKESSPSRIDLAPNAVSALLMDADTGTILYEKNAHDRLPPASITKIMTMLLIMEALDRGAIQPDEKVRVSDYAASMGGSQIFLEAGEEMTVEDLLKGIAIASGNDAAVAMAEKIAGSEELFVEKMNERARELGLENTRFANSNGLPAEDHYSSAYDIAVMSRELLKHEDITRYTGKYQDYLRENTDNPFWLVNTNKLVRFYSGADGLKTGYTSKAKFCLAATAKREHFRVIAVVLGEPDAKTRNLEISKMFDYAFSQYKVHNLFEKGDSLGSHTIDKGDVQRLEFVADRRYSVLLKKGDSAEDIRHELVVNENLALPIEKGQQIAKLKVYNSEGTIAEYDIPSPADVRKAGWWQLLKRTARNVFLP